MLFRSLIFIPNHNPTSAATTRYRKVTPTPTPIPGFTGQYFNNIDLSGTPTLTRTDNQINFDWALTSPDRTINTDYFSVRWTKNENFASGDYKFTITADDGIRFYIDNNLVLDKWLDQPVTTYEITQKITSGNHTLKMEYYDKMYHAVAKLSWSPVSITSPTPTATPTPTPTTMPTPTPTPMTQSLDRKSVV